MSVTRLKRKHRKNIARANNKQHIIKNLLRTPVLKNVDIEELKAQFPSAPEKTVASVKESVQDAAAGAVKKVKEVAQDAKATVASTVSDATAAVTSASAAVADKAKDAVDAAKEAVSDAVDTVTHSEVAVKASEVAGGLFDRAKNLFDGDDDKKEEAASATEGQPTEAADNAVAFDDAEAVTKPVNEDGQEGEHPKPEIAL